MAKVSIIIPVYNGARTVPSALASVFAQSYTDYEVVVVDDGSTDDTAVVLAGYKDRIHAISQPNSGASTARNAGIRASGGEYVAFLDDDDEWMPEMLERCAAVLDRDPNCALVYAGAYKVDSNGRPMPNQDSQTWGLDSPTLAQMLERPWNVVPSRVMVRRATLERSGGFDERCVRADDIYFLLLAREHGYFRSVPELLVRKSTRPLYPTALKRERGYEVFVRLVRERYGAAATPLIREFRRMRMKVMKHMARLLIEEGRTREARRCLARVIYYQPASPKAYRRYLKTFLPRRVPSRTGDGKA